MKQLSFFLPDSSPPRGQSQAGSHGAPRSFRRLEHGGSFSLGRRRSRRPLATKRPLHLVLRSDFAFGNRSLTRHRPLIKAVLQKAARRFHIRVYELAICTNHIHVLIRGYRREDIQNFFRVFAGHTAQEILKSYPILKLERAQGGGAPISSTDLRGGQEKRTKRKGEEPAQEPAPGPREKPVRESENKFWQTRVYSRILSWGREYLSAKKYVLRNALEALGVIVYWPREKRRTGGRSKLTPRSLPRARESPDTS